MATRSLPSHASVVVIGGGIMGCSTLYHLAKMGVGDAILLERNRLTSGTTWHSAAQVRAYGIDARSIAVDEARERWPLINAADVLGAVWSPDDGRVSPSDVCAALVKGARGRGAKLFENTGVTGILTERGRIRGVETPQGTVMCDAIALCTGLWSRETAAMAGADVPALACEHFYLLTRPIDGITGNMPTLSDHDNHLYFRDDSGGLLVGCFEPMGKPIAPGVLDESFEFGLLPEDWGHFEPMMERALHRLPDLQTAEVKMLLNGPESFTPDGTFMLAETAEPRMTFDRPDWFGNVQAEVRAAHEAAAIFDASPFGKIEVEGPDAEAVLAKVCAGFMGRAPGSVIYMAMLNDRGTFESDLTAQRIAPDHYRLFVGTAAIKRSMPR